LHNVQNKKEISILIGKHKEISLEKYILKLNREKKRLLMSNRLDKFEMQQRNMFTRLKKEPEKNKTHWDILLEEMKWMAGDFEIERRKKRKLGLNYVKAAKKHINSKQTEELKNIKRQEQNMQKRYLNLSRAVKNYWIKIDKITNYNYNTQYNKEKIIQQQNRLMNFIAKLEKISGKVANSLSPGVNKKIAEQATLSLVSGPNTVPSNENSSNSNKNSNPNSLNSSSINNNNLILNNKNNLNNNNNNSTLNEINEEEEENYLTNTANVAEKLQPKGTLLKETDVTLTQPYLLNNTLREYQLIGLNWLVALNENKINGILADEMGLGKTIQTIALFAYLAINKGNWGPHLIIVPTTIIVNWEIEFKKWCPSFKILSYFGSQKERKLKRYGWFRPNSFHVCITSYKLVIQDYSIFKRKRWEYIVLDEAQNIKNFKSKRWQMLLNFHARRKLLLTGTPLQNDIMEIWSYLHFLMPNLFYSNIEFREWFHTQFYNAIHNNAALNKQIINSLHSILRPFLLRRLKKDVEKQLPEKIEHVVYCELSRRQKYLYDEYINTDMTQNTLKKNDYFSIMNVLMQLRKVCNHPDLFDSRDYDSSMLSLFNIYFIIPALVFDIFKYDPMKSVNYKNLKLFLISNEKLNSYDYIELIKNFPFNPLFELYDEITKNKVQLFQPKYLIDENDILFKRNYSDNSILAKPNTLEVKDTVMKLMKQMKINDKKGIKKNAKENINNSMDTEDQNEINSLNEESKEEEDNIYKYQINVPNAVFPTNIPMIQNSSLSNYNDMFNDIDTSILTNEEPNYLKTVFNSEINRKRNLQIEIKKRLLHTYDINSRANLLYRKPIYGNDTLNLMKLTFLFDAINSPLLKNHIVYGQKSRKKIFGMNFSLCLNKAYKYCNSNKGILRDKDFVKITELGESEPVVEEVEEIKPKIEIEDLHGNNKLWKKLNMNNNNVFDENDVYIEILKKELNEPTITKENWIEGKYNPNVKIIMPKNFNAKKENENDEDKKKTGENNSNNNSDTKKDKKDDSNVFKEPLPVNKKNSNQNNKNNDTNNTNNNTANNTPPKKYIPHIKVLSDEKVTKDPILDINYEQTLFYRHSNPLLNLIYNPQKYLSFCDILFYYFNIYIPKVISPGPQISISKSNLNFSNSYGIYQTLYNNLLRVPNVLKYLSLFKTIKCPDRKLVEYDSGKLIKLGQLLKKLYANKSKALIFTQMTRMLDILEIFLNIHGFTYVRLDGSTKVELRQQIVDKFNNDKKVFCFISSTRSGGIGLNLTGADSIIFYDTDWNPAMDKQAQDRCHRIGQTRTVHIYRLITLSTIEENIFKKSIQKRELNYVVMEDGKFDMQNLNYNNKLNIQNIIEEGHLIKKTSEEEEQEKNEKNNENIKRLLEFENLHFDNPNEQKNIEQMLIRIEDQEDVQAMKNLSRELLDNYEKEHNEMQFFKEDENNPNDDLASKSGMKIDSKEKEREIFEKLKPIDKFALNYYRGVFTYKEFVQEKEKFQPNQNNYDYTEENNDMDGENSNMNEDEDVDMGNEEESNNENEEINKLDIETAYNLYLKKKDEILRMYQQMENEEKIHIEDDDNDQDKK
jgi:SNF2 family DNA or RNA helicase